VQFIIRIGRRWRFTRLVINHRWDMIKS